MSAYFLTSIVAAGVGAWWRTEGFNGFRAAYFWIGSVVGTTLVLILVLFAQVAACAESALNKAEDLVVLTAGSCDEGDRTTWAWYLLVRDAQEGIGIAFTFFGVVWVALVGYATRYSGNGGNAEDLREKIRALSNEVNAITTEDVRTSLLREQVDLLREMSAKKTT